MPIAVSLAVLAASLAAVAPVRDAVTLHDISGVHLIKPLSYVALAPLSDTLDAITLLSADQQIAAAIGIMALWVLLRFGTARGRRRGRLSDAVSLTLLLGCIAATDAAAALLPRPMAYLASADPEVLRIDFHSHTSGSPDARRSFSVERNRGWHRSGGYDVAYVTDHGTVSEAARALASDPLAGKDVVLLAGIEANWLGEHVGLLCAPRRCRSVLSDDLRNFVNKAEPAASDHDGAPPLMIWNHPRDAHVEKSPLAVGARSASVRAIEIANGAPHAMDLIRRKREQLVALARQHDLAMVSGSDNHGWGYVAPNWTLMRIENWRGLAPDELALRIEQTLRQGGLQATNVVERTSTIAEPQAIALAFTFATVPWRMLTTLSASERLTWLLWIWAIVAVGLRRRNLAAARGALAALPK